ncbi:MAG: DPP IV N-terminal domain-containing protein, partial [Planctomycetota bacterium]|nr:DPP IV N-terminal domain-containing protein [Planctomycetota bacterium]
STKKKWIPSGYLLQPKHGRVVDRLLMHGVQVFQLDATVELDVEKFRVESVSRAPEFQKHSLLTLNGQWMASRFKAEAGCYFVSTSQPLGRLAAYLLDPESDDGLTTWNFFDASVAVGSPFPVFSFQGNPDLLELSPVTQVEPQQKFTIEELYGLQGKVDFGGNTSPSLDWVSPTRYRRNWNGRPVWVEVETGSLERISQLTPPVLKARLSQIPGITTEVASRVSQGRPIQVSTGVVINAANDLYWVALTQEKALRLTSDEAGEELVTVSPDGKHLAFVKENNLFRVDLTTGQVKPLTTTGSQNILHGKLDWVYQEELYGRGDFKGFWWSPDSKSLAYLTLDQSKVKRYQVTDHLPVRQSHEVYPYPKAGDPNPTIGISVDGQTLDVDQFELKEPLISRVCWSPQGKVFFQLQNRIQNQLKLISWKPGKAPEILVEESVQKGWIESPGNPVWVSGREGFIWFTHRGGRRHIATYSDQGQLIEADRGLTHPKNDAIEVRELIGATQDGVFYLAANPDDVTRIQLYRLNSSGRSQAITNLQFNHSIVANPSLTYFFDYESSVLMPTRVSLRRMDGSFVRYVEPNLVDELDYYAMNQPVFQRVPTRDGGQMESMLILPPDFDESKKYPVLMHVYAGPQAPRVRNRWGGTAYLWHQLLAQKGYVVWMCDNRSATHQGLDKTYPIYGDLGRRDLMDIEDSLDWLKKKDWVDGNRIGIWGWSYGGYMTGFAMTHSQKFKMGISGAPVTDWRNYDSIYTERYMGLPAANPKGYDASSVVLAAKNLHGKLLIIHGTQDDNVHISNTYQLINALQNAGKDFELMIYPRNRHGIRLPRQALHLRRLMTDFITENL